MFHIKFASLLALGFGAVGAFADDDDSANCYKHRPVCAPGGVTCPQPELADVIDEELFDWAYQTSCEFLLQYVNDNPDDTSTEWTVCIEEERNTAYHALFTLKKGDEAGEGAPELDHCKTQMGRVMSDCDKGTGGDINNGELRYRVDPNSGKCPEGVTTANPQED